MLSRVVQGQFSKKPESEPQTTEAYESDRSHLRAEIFRSYSFCQRVHSLTAVVLGWSGDHSRFCLDDHSARVIFTSERLCCFVNGVLVLDRDYNTRTLHEDVGNLAMTSAGGGGRAHANSGIIEKDGRLEDRGSR